MAGAYAETDWEVVDYQLYELDQAIIDRQTKTALLLRGPQPESLATAEYFVCIGAAQTFGRFCDKPYPTLLQERLALPVLNLGRGGAGPAFFSTDDRQLFQYINHAKFAIIQVMSGRSESNSRFSSQGLGYYTRVSDGSPIGCDEAFRELLQLRDRLSLKHIVAETRMNWVVNFKKLLRAITVPSILFWFSTRRPQYKERYHNLNALFGEFPQLVNSSMIQQLKDDSQGYVECVSKRGLPHRLTSRRTGLPVTVTDPWGGAWSQNWYYPSPEMHADAAAALAPVCKRLLESDQQAWLKETWSILQPRWWHLRWRR